MHWFDGATVAAGSSQWAKAALLHADVDTNQPLRMRACNAVTLRALSQLVLLLLWPDARNRRHTWVVKG